jgi:hypothetical protein
MGACPGTQPAVSARVWGARRAIRQGGGGAGGGALTPSLQAAIAAESAHHARSDTYFYFIEVQFWPRFPSHAPTPRAPAFPAHVFLPRDIKVFI